MSEFVEL